MHASNQRLNGQEQRVHDTPHIAYVGSGIPSKTATFVYREIIGLRNLGVRIKTYSLHEFEKSSLSKEAHGIADTTTYLQRDSKPQMAIRALKQFLRTPLRALAILGTMLAQPDFQQAFVDRIRTLKHWLVGLALADHMRSDGNIPHIHAHFASHPTSVALVTAHVLGISFSFTAHASDIWRDHILLPLKAKRATFILTCSCYGKGRFLDQCSCKEIPHLHMVYHGIDLKGFSCPPPRIGRQEPTILNIGRLHPEKGQDLLIQACANLKKKGLRFKCFIVGGGEEEQSLTQLVKSLQVEDIVTLTGHATQEKVKAFYLQADLIALPSRADNLPNVAVEGMATGLPVVASDISGLPEIVRNGENGILIRSENVSDLEQALEKLLLNEDLRLKLGQNARRFVENHFSWESANQTIVDLLQKYGIGQTIEKTATPAATPELLTSKQP